MGSQLFICLQMSGGIILVGNYRLPSPLDYDVEDPFIKAAIKAQDAKDAAAAAERAVLKLKDLHEEKWVYKGMHGYHFQPGFAVTQAQ
jgi:hypothetical protein